MNISDEDQIIDEDLQVFFQKKIKPKLQELRKKRTASFKKAFFFSVLACIGCYIGFYFEIDEYFDTYGIKGIPFWGIIAVGSSVSITKLALSSFVKSFKKEVMANVLSSFIKKCQYHPDNKISTSYVINSLLISSQFNELRRNE